MARARDLLRLILSRPGRLLGAVVLGGSLFLGALGLAARSESVRDWLWQATGEQDFLEGVKGVGALVVLQLAGPDPALAPEEPFEHVGMNPYGVNTFLQLEADQENVRRSLAAIKDAGIGWARQEFPWEDIEIHGRGDFQDRRHDPPRSAWEKYDRIVRMAAAHNVELLVRLDNPPEWAFADPAASGEKGPPDDLEDFGNFVAAVVERYCGQVRYYQIWNEPNIYPEWGERDVDPAGYAALLEVAARRARQACSDVVIVSAALAQTTEPGGRNMDDLKYLAALYEAGWADDFDILAVQAFGLWTGPTDHRVSPDRTNFVRPLLARDIMVRYGDGAKPVWITEFGWDSPPPEMEAPYGRVDELSRARYTVAAYERIQAEWPWIGVAFVWFLRRPDWNWHQRPEGYFRLLEPDWTPTPTYDSLAGLARRRPVVLHRGRHRPDHWALTYTGPWRDLQADRGGLLRVGAVDCELTFTFEGTGFQIDLAEEESWEESSVFLVVDQDSARVRPHQTPAGPAVGRRRLPDGEHLVILRVEEGQFPVRQILVQAPAPPSPLAPLYRWLALLAGLIALIVLAAGRWGREGGRSERLAAGRDGRQG